MFAYRHRSKARSLAAVVLSMLLMLWSVQSILAAELNLNSTTPTGTASSAVAIKQGDNIINVVPGTALTDAQRIAVWQVSHLGQQNIILNDNGAAIGGSFKLWTNNLQSLSIPAGVQTVLDYGHLSTVNVAGNLTNLGTILATSSNQNINSGIINATNIYNMQAALISSNINLQLNAINNIVNYGTITSTAGLGLNAGNSIINALPAGSIGPSPIISAMQALNLQTANLVNTGVLTSQLANVNVATNIASSMALLQNSGLISALNGAINIGNDQIANLIVNGSGDYLAQTINAVSSNSAYFSANKVNGILDFSTGAADIFANTANLVIGRTCVTGDPTLYNAGGDITITKPLSFSGQALSIVASGNIKTAADGLTISTSSDTANGGNLLVVAGTKITPSGFSMDGASSTITLGGASLTGGDIDFATHPLQFLSAASLVPNGNGGNINLIAYKLDFSISAPPALSGWPFLSLDAIVARSLDGEGSCCQFRIYPLA